MDSHSISRTKRLKFLADQGIIDNFSHFSTLKTSKRAFSIIDGKKSPKILPGYKSSKIGKAKLTLDPRNNRTPEPLNLITNFVSESKSQEIRLLKTEITFLKNSLNSVAKELTELKQAYTSSLEILRKEKENYQIEFFNILQNCFNSPEIDFKFKKKLEKNLETLESSKKFQDFNFKQLLEEFSEINKKKSLFEITTQTNSSISTARFRSLNEEQMKVYLTTINEAIIIEDFSSNEEGFLSLKTGQRVQVLGKVDESLWIVAYQNIIVKIPAKFLLQD